MSLDIIDGALTDLVAQLAHVGLTIADDGLVSIVPHASTVDPDVVQKVMRMHIARRGLNTSEAEKLAAARDGRPTSQALQGRAPVLTVGRLRNAGYLTRDDPPQYISGIPTEP